ncbi:hypothetical protein [Flavobacterium phage FL-1]|nr:hypothetical protein [Flavobacterium phage FL-1]
MGVLDIRPVEGGQSKVVLGIAGKSGDGKTLTALYIARGMVDKPSEIGFLDTENKRGSLYHDALDGKFNIGDLYPPFSPSRYSMSIKEFQDHLSGIKVLIIDSVTHEWEGEGGCEDIANLALELGKKTANWTGAKREHKKFMNVLLQSNIHIICCIRARDKVKVEVVNGKQEFVPQGIQPVCEKNFMFEMTASIMMADNGKVQIHTKVPNFLKDAFGSGNDYIGIETGKKIRKWLEQGEKEDPEISRIKSEALLTCEKGAVALTALWKSLTKEQQKNIKLISHFALCGESAKAYDAQVSGGEGSEDSQLELITSLFKSLQEKVLPEDIDFIQSVIDNNTESEFAKVLYKLNRLKDEQ